MQHRTHYFLFSDFILFIRKVQEDLRRSCPREQGDVAAVTAKGLVLSRECAPAPPRVPNGLLTGLCTLFSLLFLR